MHFFAEMNGNWTQRNTPKHGRVNIALLFLFLSFILSGGKNLIVSFPVVCVSVSEWHRSQSVLLSFKYSNKKWVFLLFFLFCFLVACSTSNNIIIISSSTSANEIQCIGIDVILNLSFTFRRWTNYVVHFDLRDSFSFVSSFCFFFCRLRHYTLVQCRKLMSNQCKWMEYIYTQRERERNAPREKDMRQVHTRHSDRHKKLGDTPRESVRIYKRWKKKNRRKTTTNMKTWCGDEGKSIEWKYLHSTWNSFIRFFPFFLHISCINSDRLNESRILKPTTRLRLHCIVHQVYVCDHNVTKPAREMVLKMKTKTTHAHTHIQLFGVYQVIVQNNTHCCSMWRVAFDMAAVLRWLLPVNGKIHQEWTHSSDIALDVCNTQKNVTF